MNVQAFSFNTIIRDVLKVNPWEKVGGSVGSFMEVSEVKDTMNNFPIHSEE